MPIDPAHKATEQRIRELEKKIRKEYSEAETGVRERLLEHWGAFQLKDEKKRELVKAGKLSEEDYQHWRTGQIAVGKRWEDMRKTIAHDYMNANDIARKMADDSKADVFAINGNYAFYEIEKNAGIDMSFSLYNHDGVVRLIRDNPDVLPPLSRYGENNPVKRAIREGRIQAWEEGKIQSALVQGIVQGMTIPQLTNHISEHVGALNEASARRYARTAMTGAQNAGRYESYRRAKKLGVDLVVEWNAILDRRTRRTHRQMHGERHEVDEPFEIDGHEILYPGYPLALDALIWNCRCTLTSWVKDYEPETVKESPGMEGMTFEEWQNAKGPKSEKVKFADSKVSEAAEKSKIEYRAVKPHSKKLTEEEIIERLYGGDKTAGSCASLGLAYCGQKSGLDVIDFRGGKSQEFFSSSYILAGLKGIPGIKWHKEEGHYCQTTGNKLLKKVDEGKEYFFVCGRHAAIVRRNEGKLQYLELQSQKHSGWTDFADKPRATLATRFGAPSTRYYDASSYMFEADSVKDSPEYAKILGYINTDPEKQVKGRGGTIK